MNNIRKFKKEVWGYSLAIGLLFWIISLFFLKINMEFALGLTVGTVMGIINFQLLIFSSEKVIEDGSPIVATISGLIRMCLYGLGFLVAIKIGYISAVGCVLGFMTQKLSIFYIHIVKDKLNRRRG